MPEYRTIMERLSDELRAHGDFTDREPTPQTIPVPAATLESLVDAVKKLKAEIDRMAGRGASVADKALTLRDLLKAGAVTATVGDTYFGAPPGGGGGGGGITFPPNDPDPRPWLPIPPAPTNLSALGAFRNVILDWDLLNYQNHSHVEVYRHTADVIGSSVKIGQTTANMYADASGTSGTTYYYWVRAVSLENVIGPFNAVNGVPATLARVDTADYQNLSIVNAAIANLAVDDAKIANLTVNKLLAGSLAIGQYIQSDIYTPGFAGFQIHANGNAEFNNVTARGAIYASTGSIGAILIDANGLRSGQTAYDTGTGFWLGSTGGTPKFSIGNSAGNKMTWDGATLSLSGTLSAPTGTLGALTIASTGHIKAGKTSYADTTAGFWEGFDSGTVKWHIGDANWWLKWTGTSLEMRSKSLLGHVVGESLFYREISHAEAGTLTDGDAGVRFNTDGTVDWREGAGTSWATFANWYTPTTPGIGSSFRIRVAPEGDTLSAGGTDTRKLVALSSARTYRITAPFSAGNNSKQTALFCEFFTSSGTSALGAGTVDLFAEYAV